MKKELSTFGAASAKRSDGVARAEPNLFKLCQVTTEFEELKLLHLCRVVTKVMERSYITLNFFCYFNCVESRLHYSKAKQNVEKFHSSSKNSQLSTLNSQLFLLPLHPEKRKEDAEMPLTPL